MALVAGEVEAGTNTQTGGYSREQGAMIIYMLEGHEDALCLNQLLRPKALIRALLMLPTSKSLNP